MTTVADNQAAGSVTAEPEVTTIYLDELQPGDLVEYNGHLHRITCVFRLDGWAWPVATDDTGWAIALSHQFVDVRRNAA